METNFKLLSWSFKDKKFENYFKKFCTSKKSMEPVSQFQRYESSYRLLNSEFNVIKEELRELKQEFSYVVDENKRFKQLS